MPAAVAPRKLRVKRNTMAVGTGREQVGLSGVSIHRPPGPQHLRRDDRRHDRYRHVAEPPVDGIGELEPGDRGDRHETDDQVGDGHDR